MAAIHQQGAGVRIEPGIGSEDEPQSSLAEENVYVSPPLVGQATDYEGGVSELSAAELAQDDPFPPDAEEQALDTDGSWTSTLIDASRKLDVRIRYELNEHPYRSLAAAAAVGYMLGNGVTSKPGRLLLLLGSRYALKSLAGNFADDADDAD